MSGEPPAAPTRPFSAVRFTATESAATPERAARHIDRDRVMVKEYCVETIFFDGFDDEDDYLQQAGGQNRRLEAFRRYRTKEMEEAEPAAERAARGVEKADVFAFREAMLQEQAKQREEMMAEKARLEEESAKLDEAWALAKEKRKAEKKNRKLREEAEQAAWEKQNKPKEGVPPVPPLPNVVAVFALQKVAPSPELQTRPPKEERSKKRLKPLPAKSSIRESVV
jgi:hypothetical protein